MWRNKRWTCVRRGAQRKAVYRTICSLAAQMSRREAQWRQVRRAFVSKKRTVWRFGRRKCTADGSTAKLCPGSARPLCTSSHSSSILVLTDVVEHKSRFINSHQALEQKHCKNSSKLLLKSITGQLWRIPTETCFSLALTCARIKQNSKTKPLRVQQMFKKRQNVVLWSDSASVCLNRAN